MEIKLKKNKKFDFEKQKMVELDSNKFEYVLNKDLTQKLFNEIKFIRIVGTGSLGTSLSMDSKPFKYKGKSVYSKSQLTLSQKDDLYGVVDVRTNNFILDCNYKKINVFPNLIEFEHNGKLTYLEY